MISPSEKNTLGEEGPHQYVRAVFATRVHTVAGCACILEGLLRTCWHLALRRILSKDARNALPFANGTRSFDVVVVVAAAVIPACSGPVAGRLSRQMRQTRLFNKRFFKNNFQKFSLTVANDTRSLFLLHLSSPFKTCMYTVMEVGVNPFESRNNSHSVEVSKVGFSVGIFFDRSMDCTFFEKIISG